MPRSSRVLAIVALFLLSAGAFVPSSQSTAPAPPQLVEVAFLTSASAQSPTKWQGFDGSNVVIADINGDGKPEIVASNNDLRRFVIDPRQGIVLAEMRGSHKGGDGWGGRELNGPAVGDAWAMEGPRSRSTTGTVTSAFGSMTRPTARPRGSR